MDDLTREESILLEKWQCHECEKGFLLIAKQTKDIKIHCPFCGNTAHVEAVARQNPEVDYENGLWPGYNYLDKIAYLMSSGHISREKGIAKINDRLRREFG